jgi:hypothetical protein
MENPRRAPVAAVEVGTIKYWESGLGGCMVYLYGASGTTYLDIRLNNDVTARNDNKAGASRTSRSQSRTARRSRPVSRSPGTATPAM